MSILGKTRKFFLLNTKTKLLFLEAFIILGYARLLLFFPFQKIAPLLGVHMEETQNIDIPENKAILINVSTAINTMSNYTFWESKCLVKAITGMKMLERRGIGTTLYLGTAKDEAGQLIAHAWLRSGSLYILGAEVMHGFTVVGKFAKRVSI